MSEGQWVIIEADDSVESVAYRHGHFPDTLWDHPENAALRQERHSMHVLREGDRLFVPALRQKAVPCIPGRNHRFVRRAVPSKLRLTLKIGDEPLADCLCWIEREGEPDGKELCTDSAGRVELPLMPNTASGWLVVELVDGQHIRIPIAPRRLDPVDTVEGAQARLRNLGYLQSEAHPGELDLSTVLALAQFQHDQQLDPGGQFDAATQARLLEAHGG